ncbi:hypothetical protein X802_05690 [Thermococcus guaymasensis DSM 11113]|uniref:Uncharacterized protein n=1 Tax=Thermococcus guaymasensis DSM 11113 TaxID=1432656 RepID=A0A0X1KN90_9EURY|nr:hypothetical protein X802_05690 [Thermococcus guaymasensis DSM 11113]
MELKRPNIEPALVESSETRAECAGVIADPNVPWSVLRIKTPVAEPTNAMAV